MILLPGEPQKSVLGKIWSGAISSLKAVFLPWVYTADSSIENQRALEISRQAHNKELEAQRQVFRKAELELLEWQRRDNLNFQAVQSEHHRDLQRETAWLQHDTTTTEGRFNRQLQSELAEAQRLLTTVEGDKNRQLQEYLAQLQRELTANEGQLNREQSLNLEMIRVEMQRWVIEQQKALQLKIKEIDVKLAWELREYDRRTALNNIREQRRLNNLPICLLAEDILGKESTNPLPLRVFISPPSIRYDRSGSGNRAGESELARYFPLMEQALERELRAFCNHYVNHNRPLNPMGGAWTSKAFHGETAALAMFNELHTEPVLILESAPEGNKFDLNCAFWGMNWKKPLYHTALSVDWHESLYELAKIRTLQWQEKQVGKTQTQLEEQFGKEVVARYQHNLKMIEREQRCVADGMDLKDIDRPYHIASKDSERFAQFLTTCHCLYTGMFADEYFLVHVPPTVRQPPLLPALLPELLKEVPKELIPDLVSIMVTFYEFLYEKLGEELIAWKPQLYLELAESLIVLSDQSWTKVQVERAIQIWMQQKGLQITFNGVPGEKSLALEIPDYATMQLMVNAGDKPFFDRLENCLTVLQAKGETLPAVEQVLQSWSKLQKEGRITGPVFKRPPVTIPELPPQSGKTMSTTLTTIFNQKFLQIQDHYQQWSGLQEKIKQLLGNSASEETGSIVETDLKLQMAIKEFKHEIDNPRITLATTGTTSGGKSSLVNLLCGAEIIPVAVQEMSAGTVVIDHHSTKRALKIPPVAGLPADYSGEWSDLSDKDIRHRLQKVMDSYRQLREENREPSAPRMEIQYPTRLGLHPELAGLPEGFKLRIIDLPGLKYVADEHNRQVIREEIKPALCLVTYNSEETDPDKQQRLLEEVVEQVRELRGSPARMLFVLNRIDVFRRDENWQEQTKNFTNKVRQKIRTAVAQSLPEYQKQANEINAQPLSTYPALCAYQVLTSDSEELCVQSLEKIDSHFRALMPEELVDELPRKISKWRETERKQVAEAVWRSSYGHGFDETLRGHIQSHIPQLLLPHLVKAVTDVGGVALTNAHQIAHAYLNATKERYQAECDRLNRISVDLQQLRDNSKQALLAILDFSEDEEVDLIEQLTDIATQLQQTYQLPKDSLVPLYDWTIQLGNTIESFLSAIHKAIMEGNSEPQGPLTDSLPPQERQALSNMLVHLKESGYKKYAGNGYHFDSVSNDAQKKELKKMNQSLNELAEVIAKSLKRLLERTAEREAGRIQDAFQLLIEQYAHFISEQAHSITPDLAGLAITPSQLSRIKQQLILSFQLTAGFPIHKYQQEVYVRSETVWVGTETVRDGTERVKVGEKRVWYKLWLGKTDVYETRTKYKTVDKFKDQPVYEKRDYEAATIPSIIDIFGGFIEQAKASRTESEFVRWLRTQIDEFLTGIEEYQENLLKEYRRRLDQAMQQATQQKEMDIGKWQPVAKQVVVLQNELQELLKVE